MREGGGGEGGDMRRKLFTALSLLSLVLCVATVVLWIRSFETWRTLDLRTDGGRQLALRSADGITELRVAIGLEGAKGYFGYDAVPQMRTDWSKIPSDWHVTTFEMVWWDALSHRPTHFAGR